MNDELFERGKFAQYAARLVRKTNPGLDVRKVGELEILVDGRRLDLENLYRMIALEPSRGDEIANHYVQQLFSGDTRNLSDLSFDFAESRIMPRIQPDSIFKHITKEMVAHVPFVNNTSIVYVIDLPDMTVSITTEQLLRWNKDIDEVDFMARKNLDNYAPDLQVQLVESKEGGRAAILSEQDGYDASRLLMSGLYRRLALQLGRDFYVALPARDMFFALSLEPEPFVKRLKERVEEDYKRLPCPITSELFYVTRDGIVGMGEKMP